MAIIRWLLFILFLIFLSYTKTAYIIYIGFLILFIFIEKQIEVNKKVIENEKLLLNDLGNIINYINKYCPHCLKENLNVSQHRQYKYNAGNTKNYKAS